MMRGVAMLTLLFTACAAPPDTRGLAGTYVMSVGIDTLRLDADGRYRRTHVTLSQPSRISVDSGKWTLVRNGELLAVHGLRSRWPDHGRFDAKDGSWHAPDTSVVRTVSFTVSRTWRGAIELGVQPEIGWKYLRLATP